MALPRHYISYHTLVYALKFPTPSTPLQSGDVRRPQIVGGCVVEGNGVWETPTTPEAQGRGGVLGRCIPILKQLLALEHNNRLCVQNISLASYCCGAMNRSSVSKSLAGAAV
jgi:hypothetical protein